MWIVAVAWIYVVGLMALTEPSVIGGIMTFFFYCVVPLSIVYYIFGRNKRPRSVAGKPEDSPSGTASEDER